MDPHILSRLQAAMERHGLDGLMAWSKECVAYTCGYTVPSQSLGVRNRQFAVALNRDGRAAMLLTANELPEARAVSRVRDLRPYEEFAEDPVPVLAGILKDLGLSGGRIGLELDAIPAAQWEALRGLLHGATWKSGTEAFHEARRVKTPLELDRMRRAAYIADLAQADAHAQVREGMTEREVARIIISQALLHGADAVLMAQVAAGGRSAYANPSPSAYRLGGGDLVKIDVSVSVDGYLSDTGRSVVVGGAGPRQREVWAGLHKTLSRVEGAIRPGVQVGDLWTIYAKSFQECGLVPAVRLGHALGLGLQEPPFITPYEKTVLEPGMVLAVEPVSWTGDAVGFHLEDNLIVTPHGVENMTRRFGPDLIVVG